MRHTIFWIEYGISYMNICTDDIVPMNKQSEYKRYQNRKHKIKITHYKKLFYKAYQYVNYDIKKEPNQ